MHPYKIVAWIMIAFAIIYLLVEVILNLNDLDDDTSNIILLEASKGKFFFIPFALGAIMGHLFLGTENLQFKMNATYPVAILFGIVVIMAFIGHKVEFNKPTWFLSLLLGLGLLYGHFFWSMNFPE